MMAEHVRFECPACDLRIEANESPDRSEADAERFLRVAWCANERRALVIDAESPAFRGHCSDCGEPLALLHFPLASCPRCRAPSAMRHVFKGPL